MALVREGINTTTPGFAAAWTLSTTGVVEGELMIGVLCCDGAEPDFPAGDWADNVFIFETPDNADSFLKISWKIAGASEPAPSITGAGTAHARIGHLIRYSGYNASDPIGGFAADSAISGDDPEAPSITLEDAASETLWFSTCDDNDMPTDGSGIAAGFTKIYEGNTNVFGREAGSSVGYIAYGTTGASGAATATDGLISSEEWCAAQVEIKPAAASGTEYDITADNGSYTVTGAAAALKLNRKLAAASGSYAVTGGAATLTKAVGISAESGSYTVTGQDAGLDAVRGITAAAGSYTVSGQVAGLTKSVLLSADAGSYAITGAEAGLGAVRPLSAESGSYAVTGQDIGLTKAMNITAEAGSYIVTGAAVTFTKNLGISADGGAYAISGADANLFTAKSIGAESGAYNVTGQPAMLGAVKIIGAEGGAYTITGDDVDLTYTPAAANDAYRYPLMFPRNVIYPQAS